MIHAYTNIHVYSNRLLFLEIYGSKWPICILKTVTSYLLGKGGYIFGIALVYLSVCDQHYLKCYERIVMKFYGGVHDDTMN